MKFSISLSVFAALALTATALPLGPNASGTGAQDCVSTQSCANGVDVPADKRESKGPNATGAGVPDSVEDQSHANGVDASSD